MANFCLTTQCDEKYLQQAKEIRLSSKDNVLDYLEKYPEATLIIPYTTDKTIIKLCAGRAVFALKYDELKYCAHAQLPWFWDYPIASYVVFNNLIELGAESILIQSPLFNDLEYLSGKKKVRLIPNVAYYKDVPRKDGVLGSWIRPEDLAYLEKYNVVFEFRDCEDRPKKEEALFRVYLKGEWGGSLTTIITNLDYEAENPLLPQDLIEKRTQCHQQCQEGSYCRLCYRFLDIANSKFLKRVKTGK